MKTIMKSRRIWLPLVVMALLVAGWKGAASTKFDFQPDTRITVKGTSTMHDYECSASSVAGTVQLPATSMDSEKQLLGSLETVTVTVPVGGMECGNGTMDKKMRSALAADKAPTIKYAMTSARVASGPDAEGFFTLNTSGKLSIAGNEKPIDMSVRGMQMNDGTLHFKGSKAIKMSDWGIKPPTAMLGTMKTGDAVTVVFEVLASN